MNKYRSRGHVDIVASDCIEAARVFAMRTFSKIERPDHLTVTMLRNGSGTSMHIATAIFGKDNLPTMMTLQFYVTEL
jgi:hypothetical protein